MREGFCNLEIRFDTILCIKKLTDSQLSLPHGTKNSKNKLMSMISPIRRNSVLEKLRVKRLAVIQEEIGCRACCK